MNPNAPSLERQIPEATSAPRSLPRLRFPVICLLSFWVLTLVAGAFDKTYFVGFILGMGSATLVTLLFLGWWWCNRGFRFVEKLLGFLFVVIAAVLVGKLSHASISPFTLWMTGGPLTATAIVCWLFVVERYRIPWERIGFCIVVTLAWSYFLLIRYEGADSRLKFTTHWRWTPSAEEQYLAQARSTFDRAAFSGPNTASRVELSPGDWPSFRGPERDGVARRTSIATNWSINPPASIWKHALGPAWSSLTLVGNRLFTQEQRGEKETVVCYDAATGAQVWLHQDAVRFDEQVSGPGPRATPTFANGRLYTLGGTGLLTCLDASRGTAFWQRDIKEASGAKVPIWAFSGSPLVAGDLVIVYAGGDRGKGLIAYDSRSGKVAWTAPAGTSSYSSPQLTSLGGTTQCLMLHDGGLTAVDVNTGAKLWETGQPMKGAPRTGQPRLLEPNQLLVPTLDGTGCSLIEISRNGTQWTAANKWESKGLKPEFPDLVVYRGYAYGFDVSIFCCLNLADGKRAWKEGRYGRGQVVLLQDQNALLVSSETGELILLAADPGALKELGRFQALDGKTWNHPVVRGNRVYLRNAQEIACYALSTKANGVAALH